MAEETYENIGVWDITFFRFNDEGDPLADKNGNVIKYTANYDWGDITEGIRLSELVEV